MNIASKAMSIARIAHAGQHRRDGRTPYFEHLKAVAGRVAGKGQDVEAAAWLHDILEDTSVTSGELEKQGIPAHVIAAVELMTRSKGQSYEDYIRNLASNDIARMVKVADMLSNLADNPADRQIVKYAKALLVLSGDSSHGADTPPAEMTRAERSLLLFLETRAVDHGGLVDVMHMNSEDFEIVERWSGTGFVEFGRVTFESIRNLTSPTHWVWLSEEAWKLAHQERRERYKRIHEKRKWETTKEKKERPRQ